MKCFHHCAGTTTLIQITSKMWKFRMMKSWGKALIYSVWWSSAFKFCRRSIIFFQLLYYCIMLIQIIRISNLNWRTLIIFQLMYCDCCWSVKLVYYKIGASDIVALCCKLVNDTEKIELVKLESSMFNMMTLLWQCISSMFNMMTLLLYYCWYWLVV